MKIAIVAGEPSGDILGAGLIKAIKKRHPDAQFVGIGGPRMIEAGCQSLFPMEKLSVMGLWEVLKHLKELLGIRKSLYKTFLEDRPDVFVGVDAPDFNLELERKLKAKGIKTVHYVSPTVWAWRQKRIHKIARSVDRMLALFPFEARFYQQHNVDVRFVGHPMADMVPVDTSKESARKQLGLDPGQKVIVLLPGSRRSEVERLAVPFIQAAAICHRKYGHYRFVAPMATGVTEELFINALKSHAPDLPIEVLNGQSHLAIQAADFVLSASGTATLEATLISRPLVIAYKVAPFTWWMLKQFNMIKVNNISMTNNLAGKTVVEELLQENATAENLAAAVIRLIENPERVKELEALFAEIYKQLKQDASERAADAVLEMMV